jgi:hypothetical protein
MRTPMPMRLRLILTASSLVVALGSLSLAVLGQQEQQRQVEDSDEYSALSAVLKARYLNDSVKRYVIAAETNSVAKNAFIGYRTGITGSGATRPEVDEETSTDFDSKNKEVFKLADKFILPVPYSLATETELRRIFDGNQEGKLNMEGWDNFYKKYPGASGAISFSRVGFNAKKDQALLYVARQAGFVNGSGRFFVLSKRDNTWKIEKEVILWLS